MAFYLGIDGGGTGCRAAVANAAGVVLGTGAAGPANITSDLAGACAAIVAAARQALLAAGLPPDVGVLRAGLGLAGANAAGAADRAAALLPFAASRIVTDGETALRGALGPDDGLVAALGTGSVFAVQRGGVIREIGGKGLLLGDEGSGAWLGRALLARALRAADGFPDAPMTPLLAATLDAHGGVAGVITFAATATPADFATLAPPLFDSADPAATALRAAGMRAVTEALEVLRAGRQDGPHRAVFLGGLGAAYAALLAPGWVSVAPKGNALDGALQLARGL